MRNVLTQPSGGGAPPVYIFKKTYCQQFCVRFKEDETAKQFEQIILEQSQTKTETEPEIEETEPEIKEKESMAPKITNVTTGKGMSHSRFIKVDIYPYFRHRRPTRIIGIDIFKASRG